MKLQKPPKNELNKLLRISNQTAQDFGQLPLYAEPQAPSSPTPIKRKKGQQRLPNEGFSTAISVDLSSCFHVSIGWTLNSPSQDMLDKVNQCSHDIQAVGIDVQSVKVKIGNTVTSMSLDSKVDSVNKIIEK